MKKNLIVITMLLWATCTVNAAVPLSERYSEPLCTEINCKAREIVAMKDSITLNKVLRRKSTVDFYFSASIADCPWHGEDLKWLRELISSELDKGYSLGEIFAKNTNIKDLVTPVISAGGKPSASYPKRMSDPGRSTRFITRDGEPEYPEGLDGRYIALWQSHGYYFNDKEGWWKWQRAVLHRTVEDLYTQSYVLPFLIPMLERAGAYVMTPRERDIQSAEYVCDNDPSFEGPRGPDTRICGRYYEKGQWESAGTGFADIAESYDLHSNPFLCGTARKCRCSGNADSYAVWKPEIKERREYGVYISFKSLDESSTEARYTVKHLGGESVFRVNQTMGGGTWIFLGSFEMDGDSEVRLDNSGANGKYVSCDAVRFGGGMGKVARAIDADSEASLSGRPAYMEGALYNMIWSGVDSTVTALHEGDYTNDFAGRGPWVDYMREKKNIPFDLSLAFHSDAGITKEDSIVGTLAIYSPVLKGSTTFRREGGGSRLTGRLLCDYVQTQLCSDIRADFNPEWSRRMIWGRSYSECRESQVPSMILETLSHHNFDDMRYGQDPAFRFTVSRAVYKGILKFLSELYGCTYTVAPLPVSSFAATIDHKSGQAILKWEKTIDLKEPTADAESFIVYTRVDDGAFDNGVRVKGNSYKSKIKAGHIYSYKVEACNKGGRSFPSEILSVGIAPEQKGTVLIVNNFTRVSAPSWYSSEKRAGFEAGQDSGVPWTRDISYTGENYEFRRDKEWISDDNQGFGASWDNMAGLIVAGNTFDYPSVHGKAWMSRGLSFCSCSEAALDKDVPDADILDLICGKQVTTPQGKNFCRYGVFPQQIRDAVTALAVKGCDIFISGAYIATDVWDEVYPVDPDPDERALAEAFVSGTLGYSLSSTHPCKDGMAGGMAFWNNLNASCYCVENPNALKPSDSKGKIAMYFDGTRLGAAVSSRREGYSVFALGVPLETFKSPEDRCRIIETVLEEFNK